MLYAKDNVLISLKNFVENPGDKNYIKTALEMRKDLYGSKTKINLEDIKIKTP